MAFYDDMQHSRRSFLIGWSFAYIAVVKVEQAPLKKKTTENYSFDMFFHKNAVGPLKIIKIYPLLDYNSECLP